jgi:proline dehydrogenase
MTSIMASPRILRLSLPVLRKIANSQALLLNPDKNPALHFLIRKTLYDHFMAGETSAEVNKCVTDMKNMGFKGVILGYAKEVNVTGGANHFDMASTDAAIKAWKDGTLKTLRMIGEGDILSVKLVDNIIA